jgi:MFS transporter, UMF1 family
MTEETRDELYPKPLDQKLIEGKIDSSYRISEEVWYKKNVNKWVSYDLANTVYSMVVVSLTITPLIYILYYQKLGDGTAAVNAGNFAMAIVLLIGNIIMAVISPFLGAYADQQQRRVPLLVRITALCIIAMTSLVISGYSNNIIVILFIFLMANLFYQMGLVVYDAMLPFITDKEKIGGVSGYGIAIGYFGSFIGIGLGFALIPIWGDFHTYTANPNIPGDQDSFVLGYIPYIFPIAAMMFLIFALPIITLKEKPREEAPKPTGKVMKDTYYNVDKTIREIFKNRDMKLFLLGWLIYVDAANTMIVFMSVMLSVGLEFGEGNIVLIILALGIGAAVLFTYPVGKFVDKFGPKNGLKLVTVLWLLAILIAFFTNMRTAVLTTPSWPVYIFPLLVGPALGGGWVIERQYVTELSPPSKIGNYFGIANIFGRISAAVGPFIWYATISILSEWMGIPIAFSVRLGILTLGVIMIAGFLIILKARDVHKVFLSGARATGDGSFIDDHGKIVLDRL